EEIIENIIKGAIRLGTSASKLHDDIYMPLQQRNFEMELNKINETTSKTRFGKELFEYVKRNWTPPQSWVNVHFEYLHMNFGNGIQLDCYDYELSPSVIFGLRIAYAFFIEKYYSMTFIEFRTRALIKNVGKMPIELFKNIIRNISKYMVSHNFTFIQPFLSGTAPQAVVAQKQASTISFHLVDCPLLDNASMIRIMDHFATKFKAPTFPNRVYEWKLCAPLLQLLINTGGLPRALERLLITCFLRLCDGKTFFNELKSHDYNAIHMMVKEDLERMYNIYGDVKSNKYLAMKLIYHCVEGIPVSDKDCLDEKNPHLTIENLQRDGHIILTPYDKSLYYIRMPLFFIHIYNDILKIVDVEMMNKAFRIDHRMHWQDWELFALNYEAFRTNLAIEMGFSRMTLGELYPGAYGNDIYLQMYVDLKRLHVCEANERFPNNKKLTNKSDNEPIDLESGNVVVLNDASADFAGIILVRMNGARCLLMIQYKWDYGSKEMTKNIVDNEDAKNLNKLISEIKKIYEGYELITIIFTTQPYNGPQDKTGALIISRDNFDKHFGPVFSSLATFSFIRATNPNFWDAKRLKNILDGIGDESIDDVIKKRPYINKDHFYSENPKAKKQKLDFFPLDVPETDVYAPYL
ncbi:17281_t:CDS:2, partial [Racocetra fulgida]